MKGKVTLGDPKNRVRCDMELSKPSQIDQWAHEPLGEMSRNRKKRGVLYNISHVHEPSPKKIIHAVSCRLALVHFRHKREDYMSPAYLRETQRPPVHLSPWPGLSENFIKL